MTTLSCDDFNQFLFVPSSRGTHTNLEGTTRAWVLIMTHSEPYQSPLPQYYSLLGTLGIDEELNEH